MPTKIYHNPRCSKSRQTLQLVEDKGVTPEIILYLETPLDKAELNDLLDMLGLQPRDLMRKNEVEYKEHVKDASELGRSELIDLMIQYPKIIERPIVIRNGKARIGRPPENVLDIL